MNDRMKVTILEIANTCVTCGRSACRSVAHFEARLAQHERPPVLLAAAAASLAEPLAKRKGWGRTKAWAWIHRAFTVA